MANHALVCQMVVFFVAISVSGCSNNQEEQKNSSDIPTTSVPTASIPRVSNALAPPPSPEPNITSQSNTSGQRKYDQRSWAVATFQAGSELSDKDLSWIMDAKPGDDKYGLNLYMAHYFFDLPADKKNRLTQKYFKQWKQSLKDEEIKVSRNTTLTINFYDVMTHQFAKSVTSDDTSEQW